jgi:membrane-associated protease RseP (regulator of RpoE activity)
VTVDTFWPYVLGIAIFLVGMALSIALHEIGHLVPAKIFGVRVGQYMIGFGPTLFSFRRGETEYGIKAIPLGGYISMAGMFPPDPHIDNPDPTAERRPSRVRNLFRKLVQDARETSNETMVGLNSSRAFYALPVWKRIIVMFGGPFMNLVLGFALYAVVVCGFGLPQATTTLSSVTQCITADGTPATCSDTTVAGPAAAAGMRPGDRIVAINGQSVQDWTSGTAVIRASAGVPLEVTLERDGAQRVVTVTPVPAQRLDSATLDASGAPVLRTVGFVGISPATGTVPQPITAVFPLMGQNISGVVTMITQLPQRLGDVSQAAFTSAPRDINSPLSVVGVGRVAGEIASTDTVPAESKVESLIGLLASLNIALFVFNLVPLLPLDGGHIAGALWEALRRGVAKLRRRPDPGPFDTARLMPLTLVVVAVLGAMSLLLIYTDIVKPVQLFG